MSSDEICIDEVTQAETVVDITPDPSTARKISKTTKPFHACITELIDNSIDARTESQLNGDETLEVVVAIDAKHGGSVRIRDNARGMNASQLQNAFRLGSSDKYGKRGMKGMYGFGLKTSAIAIGSAVEVTSQPEVGFEKYVVFYDPAEIKGWNILLKTISAVPGEHGTEVVIPKRKMLVNKLVVDKLIREIGTCYHDELENGSVKINVYYGAKETVCKPIDHKWVEDGLFRGSITISGIEVPFIVGVVDKPRSIKESINGFEIFVGGRKIESSFRPYIEEKGIGLTQHPNYAKVYGRIYTSVDVLEVNTDKTGVIRNDNFWELNNKLAAHPALADAKKLAMKKNVDMKKGEHTPDETVKHEIIDHINRIVTIPKDARRPTDVEKRDPGESSGTNTAMDKGNERRPKRTHLATRKIRSKIGRFDLRYAEFPEHEAHLTSYSDETPEGIIVLTINTVHKNFLTHNDPYVYAYEEAALALMAADITDVGVATAFDRRGELLDKFLSLTKEDYVDVEVPVDNPDL